jgi:lipopolysaccharide transport system ATP-binding protein
MYVRLAFAVQAMIDPDIFVVDEALAVGDEKFQRKCFARLEELKSRGTSILFVSHSPASIIELCDKALLLDHGLRLMYGPAPEAIRAYQKLIYAPAVEQKLLVQQYLAADQSKKDEAEGKLVEHEVGASKLPSENYDAGLVPETRVVYPTQGAEIESIQIVDADGTPVNVLQSGGIYWFVMAGNFTANFEGVFFAIHIRNVSGVVVTGQRYPEEGVFVEKIAAGQTFETRFAFRMDLLPGMYFSGGGIWSSQEPNCPHRILDALMFRVAPNERQKSFGYVDFLASEPILEIA